MRAQLVGGFLAKVPRLTPAKVVALAAMLGAVVALGLLLAIPAVAMAADINKTVSVDATQDGWQDTGIFLRAGDDVVIDGSGTVDLDCSNPNFDNTPPDGVSPPQITNDPDFLAPNLNVGALIGKIDSGDPFVVGDFKTINSVGNSGELYLAVNDSNYLDNCGHFTAEIAVNHPDTRSPRVSSTIPTAGAKGVGPSANIKANFSEEMSASTIFFSGNGGAFKLFKKGSTTKVGATISYNPNLDRALLNPNNSLQRGVTYKAVVTTAARDEADNRLDQKPGVSGLQSKVWFFTVRN
jgi:Bacterial Ig-like domain